MQHQGRLGLSAVNSISPRRRGTVGVTPKVPPGKAESRQAAGEGRGGAGPARAASRPGGLGCVGSSWCWLYNTECSRKRGQAFLNVNFVLQPSGLAAIRRLRSIPREGAAQSDARTPPADADSGGHGVRRPRDLGVGLGWLAASRGTLPVVRAGFPCVRICKSSVNGQVRVLSVHLMSKQNRDHLRSGHGEAEHSGRHWPPPEAAR